MKKLLTVAATASMVASAAFAQETATTDIKHSGDFRVRYFNLDHTNFQDGGRQQWTNARTKLNLGFTKSDSLSAMVSLVHTFNMGNVAYGPSASVYSSNTPNSGSGRIDNSLTVNQAYGWWKTNDMLSFTVGRFNLDIGSGKFYSTNDWQTMPTSHDGLLAALNFDFATVVVAGVKHSEYQPTPNTKSADPEHNSYIISASLKNLPEVMKTANLVVVQSNSDALSATNNLGGAANQSSSLQHIGLDLSGNLVGLTWGAAAGFQSGKHEGGVNRDISASMFDLTLGYSMPETMGLNVWAGYHQDSGTKGAKDETYKSLFYNIRENGGNMDIVRWGNLTTARLGLSLMVMEKTQVGAEYLMYSKTAKQGATTFGPAWNATGNVTSVNDSTIGNEIDLWASHKYDNGFIMSANLGMFAPGAAMKNSTAQKMDKSAMSMMLEGGFTF